MSGTTVDRHSSEKQVNRAGICSVVVLIAVLVLGGCATRADLVPLKALDSQKRSFDFFDLRPVDQFVTHTQREENGDRTYYGDDVVFPSRTELLADQLNAAFGRQLKGRTVVISTFRVQTMQYTNRGGPSYYSTGNPVADLIGTAIGRELLASAMRSNDLNAYIQIVGKVDEQDINVDTSTRIDAKNAANGLAGHVQSAIELFLKQVNESLPAEPVSTTNETGRRETVGGTNRE